MGERNRGTLGGDANPPSTPSGIVHYLAWKESDALQTGNIVQVPTREVHIHYCNLQERHIREPNRKR